MKILFTSSSALLLFGVELRKLLEENTSGGRGNRRTWVVEGLQPGHQLFVGQHLVRHLDVQKMSLSHFDFETNKRIATKLSKI